MDSDDAKMAARLAVQIVGGALMARGIGDAAVWEAVAGLAVTIVGFVLSRRARRKLRAQALSGQAALGMAREMVGRR